MPQKPQQIFNIRMVVIQGRSFLTQFNVSYEIDEVGLRIWELCDGEHTIDEIATTIIQEYDAPYDRVLADCQDFVADLTHKGLLQ